MHNITLSYDELVNYRLFFYPKTNNIYTSEPSQLNEQSFNMSVDETYISEFDDSFYYSDCDSDLYEVLNNFMDIGNVSNDCDILFNDAEIVVTENNHTGGPVRQITDTVVKVDKETNNNVSEKCEMCNNVNIVMSANKNHLTNKHDGVLYNYNVCSKLLFNAYDINKHIINSTKCITHKNNSWGMFLAGRSGFEPPTPVNLPTIKKTTKKYKKIIPKKMQPYAI